MKNLKFNSILAITGVFVFLSLAMISCQEKTEAYEPSPELAFEEVENKFYFALPPELENASAKEVEDFLENMNEEVLINIEIDQSEISSRSSCWINWSCGQNTWLCGTGTYKYLRVWKNTCTGRYSGACMSSCNIY